MIADIRNTLEGKRILITGHTGFKGSWLSLWLSQLGAEVYGFSLEPPTSPSMFEVCNVKKFVDHALGDIRDFAKLSQRIESVRPEVIFHLAAQPLVRKSLSEPLDTLATNIMGTANLLESVRAQNRPCAVVVVSSDKCYENKEWTWGYRENDRLGGKDPYSMSKGATELVVSSWRDSFFSQDSTVRLASARAGNVLGGGDWATDRIIPDCVRAFVEGRTVKIRNPEATRPWQHVLEPLAGYILLSTKLLGNHHQNFCEPWNFGPPMSDVQPVSKLVDTLSSNWGGDAKWESDSSIQPREAKILALNCDKAVMKLGWTPTWNLKTAISMTAKWYKVWRENENELLNLTLGQIDEFQSAVVMKLRIDK